MALLQWRRFTFFDISKNADGGQLATLLQGKQVMVASSGRSQLIFGDKDGFIHLVNRQFEITSFKGYEIHIRLMQQLRQLPLLVTIGEDEPGINPLLKVWNLDKPDKNGQPTCCRINRVIPHNRPVSATALAVHQNSNLMAVGFADGSIVLFTGDVSRGRNAKQKVIHEGSAAITALVFRSTSRSTHLFAATADKVTSFNLSVKDKESSLLLDNFGCEKGCAILAESSTETPFMIGQNEAIYCYTPDGRGPYYPFEGKKILLQWFRDYLAILSEDGKALEVSAMNDESGSKAKNVQLLTVFDVQNRLVVFQMPIEGTIIAALPEWGTLLLLTSNLQIHELNEIDLQTKLSLLFKKNLYDVAVSIAKSHHYDSDGLVEIFRQYGDHLYGKGDYQGAIEQYIRTVGVVEPSYIIRKFLDIQRISHLTAYLEALHKDGFASEDHTTLLLNCYTKLKHIQKLDEFVFTKGEVRFDVDTAIRVCRQAEYFKHALELAKQHGRHASYLQIQIEDHGNQHEALEYIGKLDFEQAEDNMKKYGIVLMNSVPKETTELLKRLCTDYSAAASLGHTANRNALNSDRTSQEECFSSSPEDYLPLFVSWPENLVDFLEHIIKYNPSSSSTIYTTLLQHYLKQHSVAEGNEDLPGKEKCKEKIIATLNNPNATFNLDQALVFCQLHNFVPGILMLLEKEKHYNQIIQINAFYHDYQAMIDVCKKFGDKQPQLWVQTLCILSQAPAVPGSILSEVLSVIDKQHLVPPMMVLEVLSRSSGPTLSVVRSYLTSVFEAENEKKREHERMIQFYRDETEKVREKIQVFKTSAVIFQGSRCSICNRPLELPSLHFLCQHSYHQHCFDSYITSDNECPKCLPENKKILNAIRSQEESRILHEEFVEQLRNARDGFEVVADYFGKGIFTKLMAPDEASLTEHAMPGDKPSGPPLKTQPFSVGPGAEAKIRATEGRIADKASSLAISEGRVRLEESSRHIPASATRQPSEALVRLGEGTTAGGLSSFTRDLPKLSAFPGSKSKSVSSGNRPKAAANPFESDEEGDNPFLEKKTQPANPFDEEDYDEKLNPFASDHF